MNLININSAIEEYIAVVTRAAKNVDDAMLQYEILEHILNRSTQCEYISDMAAFVLYSVLIQIPFNLYNTAMAFDLALIACRINNVKLQYESREIFELLSDIENQKVQFDYVVNWFASHTGEHVDGGQ